MTQTNHQEKQKGQVPQPDPEVVPRAKRRTFSAAYKLRILEEVEGCEERGEIGGILRREGLYSSHLTKWRRQRRQGQLEGLRSKKRGRKGDEEGAEVRRLKAENERLKSHLRQAELIIEAQKKLSQILDLALEREGKEWQPS